MGRYKICVYAICKNEEQFVDRFVDSVQEADEIYVLDTGSTDHTVDRLKKRGVHVKSQKIQPWRFDVARNLSLELVPKDADICICIDLDEVLLPGWRKKLEELWTDGTNRLRYNYNWSFDCNQKPSVNFYIEKIHSRNDYIWTHPVHEVLVYQKENEVVITTDEITVNHYPDYKKSRGSYLPLLELSVKENPDDDRNVHYLGREYMYYGRYQESIDMLIRHLNLKTAVWKDERCASMRFIARCYRYLKRYDEAEMWLQKAIKEAPYLRDPYMEMALLYYELSNWKQVEYYVDLALSIVSKEKTYINEPFSWNETPYDLLSLSYFYQERYPEALTMVNLALEYNPTDARLKENRILIQNRL